MVYAAKWAITCVSAVGPVYGELFWYHLVYGMTSMVAVDGSFLDANRAHCTACWAISTLCGCVYPIPFQLYRRAIPGDPKIFFM